MKKVVVNCSRADQRWQAAFLYGTILLVVIVSIPLHLGDPTPDVSWLITMCERIWNGEIAYVDVFETTPPVPMLLYMPGVILSQLTGLTAEAITFAFAYAAGLFSLGLSARILPHFSTDGGRSRWLILLPASLVLFVLPNDAFAQREYFAAAFALPIVAVFYRHADQGTWPVLVDGALAAALAGITMAIKPPLFAIPGLVLAAFYWWRTTNLSFLFSSRLLAAGVFGLMITAASFAAFPHYLGEISTVMRDVYIPVRNHPLVFLNDKACLGTLSCLGLVLLLSAQQKPPAGVIPIILVATGFLITYFIQGKFFPYQIFPAALFTAIAACIMVCRRMISYTAGPTVRLAGASGVYGLALAGISVLFLVGFDDRRPIMSDLSWASALDRPTALAISPDIATAFPLARRIGAIWVDRSHSQWVAKYSRNALQSGGLDEADIKKFLRYSNNDLERILRQIREKAPEIIIQDVRYQNSALAAELAVLSKSNFLQDYEPIAEEGGIRILRRLRSP